MNTGFLLALFLGCLASTAALVPAVMRFARSIDAVDRGGYRKVFKGEMPLLGGLAIAVPAILLALVVSIAGHFIVRNWQWVWMNHRELFSPLFSLAGSRKQCLTFALGGAAILGLGLADDIKGLPARFKLLGQVVVALIVCFSGLLLQTVSIPFVGSIELGVGIGGLVTAFWVIGLINAFNLIDGIDGLAAGMGFIGAAALAVLSILQENTFVTFAGVALTGGLLGFLPYNFPPAKLFLGDTGSMFIGYALSVISLMGAQKSETAVIVFAPMLALSFPVFETLVSILRRYIRGVPVFVGDNFHTHHRLLRKGYSEPRVVLTLYGTGFLLSVAAVMSAVVPEDSYWSWCPYTLYFGTLLCIAWVAGYLRPTTFKTVLERRYQNRKLQALARYASLCLDVRMHGKATLLLELCRNELGLLHIDVRMRNGDWFLASPGGPDDKTKALPEQLLVKSADGQDILISYEFLHSPGPETRQDVSTCLARIFDGLTTPGAVRPKAIVNVSPDGSLQANSGER